MVLRIFDQFCELVSLVQTQSKVQEHTKGSLGSDDGGGCRTS